MPTMMYVCDSCFENASEACGHVDRDNLRVLPDGDWACEVCFYDMSPSDMGYDSDDGVKPAWRDLPLPPSEAEKHAKLVSDMIDMSPWSAKPMARGALGIAASAILRGRHLTDAEKIQNFASYVEEANQLEADGADITQETEA